MKARVLISFIDKETRVFHEVGAEIVVSESRAKEILAAGKYIEVIDAPKASKTPRTKKDAAE